MKRKTLKRNCEVCSEPFDARLDAIKDGYGRFCSRKCAWLGFSTRKHGHSAEGRTPTYRTWKSMHWRCSTNEPNYEHVSVCERWGSFENFLADMGERPAGTTIDRFPDRHGNYEPSNCRWATNSEQARNRRDSREVDLNGKTQCVKAWSQELGVPESTIKNRLNRGLSAADALAAGINYRSAPLNLANRA